MKNAKDPSGSNQIVLTGASGLIGSSLRTSFQASQREIVQLVRPGSQASENEPTWDPYAAVPIDPSSVSRLEGSVAAIHLSGANVSGHRWTDSYKKTILESRTQPTLALAKVLAGLRAKPSVLLSASAIGIYGNRGSEYLDEASGLGSGFLAEVCQAWEKATQPAADAGIRVVHLRFGVVLAPEGGALAKMLPIFRLGLGGRLGSGRQWMSWVALPDVVRAIEFTLNAQQLRGAVNVVAPQPVTNSEFTHALGQVLRRPTLLPAPAFALKATFGEMAEEALLASQRAVPERLEAASFNFQYRDIQSALRALTAKQAQESKPRSR
jgi:uncharacterized protein